MHAESPAPRAAGVYADGMSFHRVVKGFVIQSGHLPTRIAPLGETQQNMSGR